MSDSLPQSNDAAPAKKAAKKTAKKAATKAAKSPVEAVSVTPATKVPAKKAAKKAAAKVAKKIASAEPPAPAPAPAVAPTAKKAARKTAKPPAPAPEASAPIAEAPKKRATKKSANSATPVVAPNDAASNAAPKNQQPAQQPHQDRPVRDQQPQQQNKAQHPQKQQYSQNKGQQQRPQHGQQNGQQNNNQRPQQGQQNDFKKNKFQNNKFDRNNKQKNKPFQKNQPPAKFDPDADRNNAVLSGPKTEAQGLLEIGPKGSGFLRSLKKSFELGKDDPFVSAALINKLGLRPGVILNTMTQMGPRGPQVVEIVDVNGASPDDARRMPHFEELTAVNPCKRIPFENDQNRFTTRVLDIVAPVGRGQRGLIVSPPRSGKTTLMLHIAESVMKREDDNLHLIILLVDERPEEVTEFRRALPQAEIFASSNDEHPRNHCRIAELTIERAKRLVEAGKHVFLLMDSITRLARAYNNTGSTQGRGIGTGGVTVGALEIPRRLFAAARNTREAGSLTILATALIQTNSRADEAIFQEFKGTGNMEIVLDRKIAENYIYPAVDIFKSGTRREELLLPEHMLHKIFLIRRGLSGHKPLEAMERLTYFLKKFPSNAQMLLEIKG